MARKGKNGGKMKAWRLYAEKQIGEDGIVTRTGRTLKSAMLHVKHTGGYNPIQGLQMPSVLKSNIIEGAANAVI